MQDELKEYGLSDKEVQIYLAALKQGACTANELTELTNIRRSTVYEVMLSLRKKGLMSQVVRDKKFYFSAAKPETFVNLLKDKEKKINFILPELRKMAGIGHSKPKVETYEGIRGIKTIAEEMLDSKEIIMYGASNVGDKILGSYTSNFAKRRVERKVRLRAIIEEKIPKHMTEKDVLKFTDIKTSRMFRNHDCAYFIYGNNVVIITVGDEITATKITNNSLVNSQRKLFEEMWRGGVIE